MTETSAFVPNWTRIGRYRARNHTPGAKRLLDLLLILVSAPVWLPLFLITAIVVRCRMGLPIIYRQARPGLRGETFELIKFRTMTGAFDSSGDLLPDAQRLTKFGRWLRSTSLDELPELFNVLRGEMSLVGPRPLLTRYLERYSPEQARRHELPPGLTGWVQIWGRNKLSWEQKFRLDCWYIDHASLGLDLWIIGRTFLTVIRQEGISSEDEMTMPEFQGTGDESNLSSIVRKS